MTKEMHFRSFHDAHCVARLSIATALRGFAATPPVSRAHAHRFGDFGATAGHAPGKRTRCGFHDLAE